MNKNKHLRKKAIQLRENGYSRNDISSMLGRSKSTVYYWIRDVEIKKPNAFLMRTKRNNKEAARKAALAVRRKFEILHEQSREKARSDWDGGLKESSDFRLFLMLYWCEGWRKSRHCVAIANSDSNLIRLADEWLRRINTANKKMDYSIQVHADQNVVELVDYWERVVGSKEISIMHKSNSGQLRGRNWASMHGVFTIRLWDAFTRTKMDEWLKLLGEELFEQESRGVAQPG